MNPETALAAIKQTLASKNEWLLIHRSGKSFALQNREIEITLERGKLFLGFLDENGFQLWRVAAYAVEREILTLEITRNFGRESEKITVRPRVSAADLSRAIELARLEKANRIAALIAAETPKSKLLRVALNAENGRFAEIVLEQSNKKQIAVLSDVSGSAAPETILTTAIFWSVKSEKRKKNPTAATWILAESDVFYRLRRLRALLKENWQSKIIVKRISRDINRAANTAISEPKNLRIKDLWREKPPKIAVRQPTELSATATEIISLAPAEIDVVFGKHGETVRFQGLPFARVRRFGGEERCWFGIESDRRILDENTRAEFFDLLEDLRVYRRFDAPNKRHDFYRLAAEAWLEAILRRNINLLDKNLILSPIHQQFRAGGDRIDLLALRRDGRLIVVEIKTQPDAPLIFQAADYWREIEIQRRSGNLRKAKVFGDLEISDEPALVFLVAPTLSFHYQLDFLAQTVAPEIECYRFELNETWRENTKVMKVSKVEN